MEPADDLPSRIIGVGVVATASVLAFYEFLTLPQDAPVLMILGYSLLAMIMTGILIEMAAQTAAYHTNDQ